MPTKIEWCDETINPVVGCSKVSEACANNQCDGCDALRTELSKWESGQKLFMGDDFGDNIPAVMEALRAENAVLKQQIASGLLLPEVDLSEEIAEAEYLCLTRVGFDVVLFHGKGYGYSSTDGYMVIKAYGPLPEAGKE